MGKDFKIFCLLYDDGSSAHLYSAADVIVVGRFAGQDALAGVGTCTVLVNLFLNFFLGLSAGATVVPGQAIGAKNKDGIGKVVHTSIAIAIYGGAIVTIACLLFTKQLLHMIDVPQSVMPEAADYLRVIAIGYIPSLLYNKVWCAIRHPKIGVFHFQYCGTVRGKQLWGSCHCGKFLIGLYTKDLSVAAWAWRKLRLIGSCYGIIGVMNVISGALRGMGASLFNMITSIIGVCGIRVLWILTAFRAIGTYEALWASYPLSWIGTLILHFIMFLIIFRKETGRNQM